MSAPNVKIADLVLAEIGARDAKLEMIGWRDQGCIAALDSKRCCCGRRFSESYEFHTPVFVEKSGAGETTT